MVVFACIFAVISIFIFVLILVPIILNVSLLKSLNPTPSLSSCLPGTDHHIIIRITDKFALLELYLRGDISCDLLSEVVTNDSSHLLIISNINGLSQLITEPNRIT